MGVVNGVPGRSAAILSVIVLIALVGHNAYWLFENQLELPTTERPHHSARDIEQLARESRDPRIRGRFALLYHLARQIPGAALTITSSRESDRWWFERVARLKVTTSPVRLVIAPASVRKLRAVSANTSSGLWSGSRQNPIDLTTQLQSGVSAYVLAERRDGRELFLFPATDFPTLADRR